MAPNLLILGGTAQATLLAQAVVDRGLRGTVSLAGRVARPKRTALPQRLGGFGGVAGLATYLRTHQITHVIDATHPFAARISQNAAHACDQAGVPLLSLTRPPWSPTAGDDWMHVPNIAGAVAALGQMQAPRRVMLAIGRMHVGDFAVNPQHFYLLRLVDPPEATPPFPHHRVIVSRGPFTVEGDMDVMRTHGIDLVVSKNSGGAGAYAKIAAARHLRLPVMMIDRPTPPDASRPPHAHDMEAVFAWLIHSGTDLGV